MGGMGGRTGRGGEREGKELGNIAPLAISKSRCLCCMHVTAVPVSCVVCSV